MKPRASHSSRRQRLPGDAAVAAATAAASTAGAALAASSPAAAAPTTPGPGDWLASLPFFSSLTPDIVAEPGFFTLQSIPDSAVVSVSRVFSRALSAVASHPGSIPHERARDLCLPLLLFSVPRASHGRGHGRRVGQAPGTSDPVARIVAERCDRWSRGEAQSLFVEATSCASRSSGSSAVGPPTRAALASQVRQLVLEGQYSRACGRIRTRDVRPAPVDQTTVDTMEAHSLHPRWDQDVTFQRDAAFDSELPAPDSFSPPTPSADESRDFASFLSRLPTLSAADLLGVRLDYYRQLGGSLASQLFIDYHRCCGGYLSPEARDRLARGRLIALLKGKQAADGRDEVRPIVCGDAMRRLVARFQAQSVAKQAAAEFSPLQFGCGVSGGVEVAPHLVRAALDTNPSHAVLTMDIRNAFNAISRLAIFKAVQDGFGGRFRHLLRWLTVCYGKQSTLHFGPHRLSSVSGSQQGDPLGGLYFCLAFQEVLRQVSVLHPSCMFVAYYDDLSAVGPPADLPAVFRDVERLAATLSLELRRGKCHAWSPTPLPPSVTSDPLLDRVVFHPSAPPLDSSGPVVIGDRSDAAGLVICGAPLGHASFQSASASDVAASSGDLVHQVSSLEDTHIGMLLLRFCCHPRFGHVLRLVPPSLVRSAATVFDRHMLAAVARCQRMHPDALRDHVGAWDHISLPTSLGGAGVTSAVRVSPAAWLGSWSMVSKLLMEFLPLSPPGSMIHDALFPLSRSTLPVARHIQDAWSSVCWLPSVCSSARLIDPASGLPSLDRLPGAFTSAQRVLARAVHLAFRDSLISPSTCPSDAVAARVRSSGCLGAKAFLHFPSRPEFFLESFAYRIMFAFRFGLSMSHIGRLDPQFIDPSHPLFDPTGHTALDCGARAGSSPPVRGRHHTHESVAVEARSLADRMGFPTRREVVGFFYSGESATGRRPDFVSPTPSGCYRMYDVSIVDHCSSSSLAEGSARHDLVASRARDRAKVAKYDREDDPASCTALGHTFTPLSMESSGAFGPSFSAWFSVWLAAQREAELEAGGSGWQTASLSLYWQQRISAALHRSIACRMLEHMVVHTHDGR